MQKERMIDEKVREKVENVTKKKNFSCSTELIPGLCRINQITMVLI